MYRIVKFTGQSTDRIDVFETTEAEPAAPDE
jgi:hypothetical protein